MHLYVADACTYTYSRKFVHFWNTCKKSIEIVSLAPPVPSQIFKRGPLFIITGQDCLPVSLPWSLTPPLFPHVIYRYFGGEESNGNNWGLNIDPNIYVKKLQTMISLRTDDQIYTRSQLKALKTTYMPPLNTITLVHPRYYLLLFCSSV